MSEPNNLFTRAEALGGLTGRRATRIFSAIQARTVYTIVQSEKALWCLLDLDHQRPDEYDRFEGIIILGEKQLELTIHDLEQNAENWSALVGSDPKLCANLARLFGNRYQFTRPDIPQIEAILKLNQADVQEAFSTLYNIPIVSIFSAESITAERLFSKRAPTWVDQSVLRELQSELEWIYLPRSEVLFQQGDPSDSLYLIASGRVQVSRIDEEGRGTLIRQLGQNEIFGELALLTNVARSATITAIRDTELLRLSRTGVERLTNKHPQLIIRITRDVLKRISKPGKIIPDRWNTLAIVAVSPKIDITAFSHQLVTALREHNTTLHLNHAIIDKQLGPGTADTKQSDPGNRSLLWLLNEQEMKHHYVLYECDSELSAWTRRCIRQADRILLLTDATANPSLSEIEKTFADTNVRIDLALLQSPNCVRPEATSRWLQERTLRGHFHLRDNSQSDFERLARFLASKAVGLVRGIGAARGFAHIGVLKALEEENVVIDYIGGASAGGIIGSSYAAGFDIATIRQRYLVVASKLARYVKLTLPFVSLFSIRDLVSTLKNYYGDAQIEDQWLPFFCIASDLYHARQVILKEGLIWKTALATMAIPGVLPPVIQDGVVLVDGGMLNALPIDEMRYMCSGGLVIAVDVDPEHSGHLRKDYNAEPSITGFQLLWSRLNPFIPTIKAPSFVSIMLHAVVFNALQSKAPESADFLIKPPLEDFEPGDFGAVEKMIEIGYQTAKARLKDWNGPRYK